MAYIPELIKIQNFRPPHSQTWRGSLRIPIIGGTHAQKNNPVDIAFSKTGSYGWHFWAKFDVDDNVYRQIVTLGSLGNHGYRIVKDRLAARNLIAFQEVKTFSADKWLYPEGFDITKWHDILITWVGNSASSVSTYFFLNGIWISKKVESINWSNAVASTGPIVIGYDWADHTIGGNVNDIAFFNKRLHPDDAYKIMYRRNFSGAAGLWTCEDQSGNILHDSFKKNDMQMYNSAAFHSSNQSWSNTRLPVEREIIERTPIV